MQVSLIGIDLAKNILQVAGVNRAGRQIFNKTIKRNKLLDFLHQYPNCIIAMEACSGSNYWGRALEAQGFEVRLLPPIHVKPFVKGNKNDRNDAFAITEAAVRPHMQFVKPRTLEQTNAFTLHKVGERWMHQKVALTNQLRGLLSEYGIVIGLGDSMLRAQLADILEDANNGLSLSTRALIQSISQEWSETEERLAGLNKQMQVSANQDADCQRLMGVKGISTITATAVKAFAGNAKQYKNGRHFSANLGLVPKQHSSGGKQSLGGITKRGNG